MMCWAMELVKIIILIILFICSSFGDSFSKFNKGQLYKNLGDFDQCYPWWYDWWCLDAPWSSMLASSTRSGTICCEWSSVDNSLWLPDFGKPLQRVTMLSGIIWVYLGRSHRNTHWPNNGSCEFEQCAWFYHRKKSTDSSWMHCTLLVLHTNFHALFSRWVLSSDCFFCRSFIKISIFMPFQI